MEDEQNTNNKVYSIGLIELLDIFLVIFILMAGALAAFIFLLPEQFQSLAHALSFREESLQLEPSPSPTPEITLTATPSPTLEPTVTVGKPVRLKITKLNLDTTIEEVGLTPEGNIDAPKSLTEAGWFKEGKRPGEFGSAIIDGHRGVSEWGIFQDLHRLKQGDLIIVTDDLGNTLRFMVKESRIYGRDERPLEIFEDSERPRLNLITCEGQYQRISGGTPNRLVVFTDLLDY